MNSARAPEPPPLASVRGAAMRLLAAVYLATLLSGAALAAVERTRIDFDYVRSVAMKRASEPHRVPEEKLPPHIAALNYDDYRKLEFRRDRSLWHADGVPFQMQLFPRGGGQVERVIIHEFSATHEQVIPFDPAYYKIGSIKDFPGLPSDLGFAGFKILHPLNRPDAFDELIVFLGASYFRALATGQHYGLSARGLALDSGIDGKPEEFPRFSEFWVGKPDPKAGTLTLYALLESQSATGAFEFIVTPGKATFIDTRVALIFRQTDKMIGIAPLTSMFWYGENTDRPAGEMRPEIHDSDGLFVRTEDGALLWRPLRNPHSLETLEIPVRRPARFGLAQRDRRLDNYEDREARYERRPSAWIEPREGFGAGTVRLVELAATKEYGDNIVAYWVPEKRPEPRVPYELRYRLVWASTEPPDAPASRVMATREGVRQGNQKGRVWWVDFSDAKFSDRPPTSVKLETEFGPGVRVVHTAVEAYPEIKGWRVALELEPEGPGGTFVELRCALRDNEGVFSERWLYRWKL